MSVKGKGRKTGLVWFKVITVLLGLLSVLLLVCAGLAAEFYDNERPGPPYFLGGFIVGLPALAAALVSMGVVASTIGKDPNDLEMKKLGPMISCQYLSTMITLPACFIGAILTGVGGFADYTDNKSTNQSLAVVILSGCIMTFCVVITSMCTVNVYGKYFGVIINKRGRQTSVTDDSEADTVGTTPTRVPVARGTTPNSGADSRTRRENGLAVHSIHTSTSVFTTTDSSNNLSQLEQHNRLLREQLQLQQQLFNQQQRQQQQHNLHAGEMYPLPPLYNDPDPAYPPPVVPPPPYSRNMDKKVPK